MSKFLFSLWEGGGETPPIVSLIRATVRAGHDVTVLADPVLRPDVEDTGAAYRSWTEAPAKRSYSPDEDLARDWEPRSPLGKFKRFRDGVAFGPAARYAHDVRAEIDRRRPDVVVNPTVMFGAQAATEAAGVAQAILLTTVYVIPGTGASPYGSGWAPPRNVLERGRLAVMDRVSRKLWASGLPALNATRAELGLAPVDSPFEQLHGAERFLVLSSPDFDFVPPSPPANVRWVGPRLEDPVWAEPWTPPPGDDPLVLVGLSSTYMEQGDALRRIVAALGELPVRGVVTLGPAFEEAIDAPSNVTVLQSAPHGEVLKHASAVITHAGHGTTIKALAAGVPVVAMPFGRDQPDTAARVVEAGAGVRIKPSAKPGAIAAAVRAVLTEPRHAAGARRLAEAIRADTATDLALGELEALAYAPSTSSSPASSSTGTPRRSAFSSLEPGESPATT